MQKKAAGRFRTLVILTLAAVYFLLLLGGLSRSAGAGMGCPDWPRCFGLDKLPTAESELPADYKERYADRAYDSLEFNAHKTGLEYINRWVGAGIGVLVFLVLLFALPFLKTNPPAFYLSLAAFLLVGFQGWLGVKVVDPGLMPVVVAVHMVVTLAIVAVLLVSLQRVNQIKKLSGFASLNSGLMILMWVALLVSVVQIVLGVQVREEIDNLALRLGYENRRFWVAGLGNWFLIHRLTALVIVVLNGWLFFKLRGVFSMEMKKLGNGIGLVVFLTILSGYAMAWFGIPAFVQPLHLLLPCVLFGLQVQLLLRYRSLTKGRVAVA